MEFVVCLRKTIQQILGDLVPTTLVRKFIGT